MNIDRVVSETEFLVDAVISESNVWLCPVCEIKRTVANHEKCSTISQRKHQQEREKQSGKNAATL
ncbi:MAG: hypothetical protein WCP96_17435 [Methylococcaceae bacterium]